LGAGVVRREHSAGDLLADGGTAQFDAVGAHRASRPIAIGFAFAAAVVRPGIWKPARRGRVGRQRSGRGLSATDIGGDRWL
jgi:hypothetical protein